MSRKALDPDDTLLDADFAATRTVAQLRTIAKSMNISLTGITRKADIIKVLSTYPKKKAKAKSKGEKFSSVEKVKIVYILSLSDSDFPVHDRQKVFGSISALKNHFTLEKTHFLSEVLAEELIKFEKRSTHEIRFGKYIVVKCPVTY